MAKSEEEIHQEILREAVDGADAPSSLYRRWRRPLIALGAIVLIILTFIFLLPGTAIDFIRASSTTYEIEDAVIYLPQGRSIQFGNGVYGTLLDIYAQNQKAETKFCLEGYLENEVYHVLSIQQPEIYSQSFSHVSSEQCPKGTIIDLHTHPYRSCFFSPQDLRTYDSIRMRDKDALLGMMCEKDRFRFYGG